MGHPWGSAFTCAALTVSCSKSAAWSCASEVGLGNGEGFKETIGSSAEKPQDVHGCHCSTDYNLCSDAARLLLHRAVTGGRDSG